MVTDIGKRIKQIRKERRQTLAAVAQQAGVSKGLVSKIENGRAIPSLPVLFELIRVLGYTPEHFFKGMSFASNHTYVLRKANEQIPLQKEEESTGFHYFYIFEQMLRQGSVEAILLHLAPGAQRDKVITDAYEFKYLLEGSVEYHLEDEVIPMETGDFLFFDGRVPHVPRNTSDKMAKMLVFYLFHPHISQE